MYEILTAQAVTLPLHKGGRDVLNSTTASIFVGKDAMANTVLRYGEIGGTKNITVTQQNIKEI